MSDLVKKRLSDLRVGATAEHRAFVDARTVEDYAVMVGDHNPIHENEAYAAGTRFGTPVAHGLLVAGYAQTPLTELVAPGGVSVGYTVRLTAPVPVGSWVVARATCTSIDPARGRAVFDITVRTEEPGETVAVSGEATIAFPREKEPS